MGLDTTHGCFNGPYSAFMRFRIHVAEAAGYGVDYYYKPYLTEGDDPILILLNHSDCDGIIEAKDCAPLADAMEALLPKLETNNVAGVRGMTMKATAETFIEGLRLAARLKENVEFM
jgi:hypothetical protein